MGVDPGLHDDAVGEAASAWFGRQVIGLERLPGQGFSGGVLIHVRTNAAAPDAVLKSFEGNDRSRVVWAHELARHLRRQGCLEVAEPLALPTGETVFLDGRGHGWEAQRFVPGVTTDRPSRAQADAAAMVLARIHRAAASWPAAPPRCEPPLAILRRVEAARHLLADPWRPLPIGSGGSGDLPSAMAARVREAAAIGAEAGLNNALRRIADVRTQAMPLQAVLRDIWSGHVLYESATAARVAGIVDLHAASIDTPATDLARLLGSWQRPDAASADAWLEPLDAYAVVRPLGGADRHLVAWLHAAGTIAALDNWFRWVGEEGRQFREAGMVLERVDRLLGLLPGAIRWLQATPDGGLTPEICRR